MIPPQAIHLILCSDRYQFLGIAALIRSVIHNTRHPEAVFFHLVSQPGEIDEITDLMRTEFSQPVFRYEIKAFDAQYPALQRYIRTAAGEPRISIPHRASAINCSRFYFCDLFPTLGKVIYLDIDIIVQGDVAELFAAANLEHQDLAAVPLGSWKHYVFKPEAACFRDINFERPGFNAGVFVTDLDRWRTQGITAQVEHWMDLWCDHLATHDEELFCYGSQTVMNATFQGAFQALPKTWNVWGLGFGDELTESDLRAAQLLHWTGPAKPWTDHGLYKPYWEKYATRRLRKDALDDGVRS